MHIPPPIRRTVRHRRYAGSAVEAAAAMLGRIAPGDDLTGLTNGQFSLIDIIEHCLNQTGPAHVIISTWTMGIYDADRAAKFCSNGQIRRIQWLVDPSMFGRRPELSGRLLEAFGPDQFRSVNTHAKFAVIAGDALQICVRSSMNLNPNRRFENFDISADAEMCAWFRAITDQAFADISEDNRNQSADLFRNILREYERHRADPAARAAAGMFTPAKNPFFDAG